MAAQRSARWPAATWVHDSPTGPQGERLTFKTREVSRRTPLTPTASAPRSRSLTFARRDCQYGGRAGAAGSRSRWRVAPFACAAPPVKAVRGRSEPSIRQQEAAVDAKRYLVDLGKETSRTFAESRSILSFEEYLDLALQQPRQQLRGAAHYLRDAIDAAGTREIEHPTGPQRRFRLFDAPNGDPNLRVAGQEEVQNAIYRVLSNFTRAGRVQKLILLHGPNGSAKSSIVRALKRGLESYSARPEGALYRFSWIFPTNRIVRGSIGFGERVDDAGDLTTFARLEA